MTGRIDDVGARAAFQRLDELLERVDALPAAVGGPAAEAVELLVQVYGEALARVLDAAAGNGDLLARLAGDELLGHLLVAHGVHPEPVEARVERALEDVRPYLRSHGGDVALTAIDDDVAVVRLSGACDGCASSAATLTLAVEEAILTAAPELSGVRAEQAAAAPPVIPIEAIRRRPDGWHALDLPPLADGEAIAIRADGVSLLVARAAGALYAYRDGCGSCGSPLAGRVDGDGIVGCGSCGARYRLRDAGRRADGPDGTIEPVPLLETQAGVRVGLRAPSEATG